MRIKEKAVAAIAVMTAAVSLTAFTAGAAGLGASDESAAEFEFNNEITEVTSVSDTMVCTVTLGEDSLPAGKYTFKAQVIADAELEDLFKASLSAGTNYDYMELIDLSFTDETGEEVSPQNVLVSISFAKNRMYNAVFIYEKGVFTPLTVDVSDGFTFTAPHCSRFVIAQLTMIGEPISSEIEDDDAEKKPTDTNSTPKPGTDTVNTGDNADTTAIAFTVLSVAALAAAVVAVKREKGKAQ